MKKQTIFNNDWLSIHPYKAVQPSDKAYVAVANELYDAYMLEGLPDHYRKRMALYLAAYLEDVKSNLGLWNGFTSANLMLYGKLLPFYETGAAYDPYSINREDVRFIVWNTWQKAHYRHEYISPYDSAIEAQTDRFFAILTAAYDKVEENESLNSYFESTDRADEKMQWLFAHTYLTEPYMHVYIDSVKPEDIYYIPTGPLALFLYEWIDFIALTDEWTKVKKLCFEEPELTPDMKKRNAEIYRNFTRANDGRNIVYLDGYDSLRRFLVDGLHWPDDENHTLPQMKEFRNFVLMCNKEKGMLLAKDICECIADPNNPIYNKEKAKETAFTLLTQEMTCPPDLLKHCLDHNLLPDAVLPGTTDHQTIANDGDFIARHALGYYYTGD